MGYKAIILTVDSPRYGYREADERNNFTDLPSDLSLVNFDMYKQKKTSHNSRYTKTQTKSTTKHVFDDIFEKNDDTLEWKTAIPWLQSITNLPIIIKGILTAEDACEAIQYGVQGIIVSNHGGRQLDGSLSSIESLEDIVLAVRKKEKTRTVILLDSGVRRGTDVVKSVGARCGCCFAW